MRAFRKVYWLTFLTLTLFSFQNCGGGPFEVKTISVASLEIPVDETNVPDGFALYANKCASCHAALDVSQKIGRTAAQIKTAIGTVTQMSNLGTLTDVEIAAIATSLAPQSNNPVFKTCDALTDLPAGQIFRLSRTQYANELNSLFGVTNASTYLTGWPSETVSGSFENNGLALDVNEVLLTALMIGGEKLIDDVWANATLRSRILPCALTVANCPNQVLKGFLDRAFRRSVSASEVGSYVTVYNAVKAQGETDENSIKASLQAILVSPSFMYNAYVFGSGLSNGRKKLTQVELASRISFMIWGTGPDAVLMDKAKSGALGTRAAIETEVKRMLQDSRSSYLSRSFFDAWLIPSRFMNSSSSYFYLNDAGLKSSMLKETQTFFDRLITRDARMTEIFTSDETFINQTMATHYGFSGTFTAGFQSYSRAEGLGMLNHASIMSLTGRQKSALNVIHRGKWVMDTLLCQGPPPPANPSEVADIVDDQINQGLTTREMANFRSANASCVSCHSSMDGFGFTLEGLSSLGKPTAGAVDNLGRMPNGQSVTGVAGLRDWLMNQDTPKGCVAQHLSAFAFGRPLAQPDVCVANKVGVDSWNLKLSEWLTNVIESDGFQQVK